MMADKKDCLALPERVLLRKASKVIKSRKFVTEKQQLESGPSNPNWLEDVSRRKLQQRTAVVKSCDSVVNSPVLTPRISQICSNELRVGSTPDSSSYSPKTVERLLSSLPCGSTPDILHRPVLGNSPCPVSPIGILLGISQPGTTLAQSLGANVEESALNWTNSLATPPGDMSVLSEKSPADSGKTKVLVRQLFSPGKKLDTSTDSVHSLESTWEDESCDHGLESCDTVCVNKNNANYEGSEHRKKMHEIYIDGNILNLNCNSGEELGNVVNEQTNVDSKNKVKRCFEVTQDHAKRTSSSAPPEEKELHAISPLQNLVETDIRPLNTSLNESTDLTHILSRSTSTVKTEANVFVDDACLNPSNSVGSKIASPICSPKGYTHEITSPTFSQKSSRNRNKIISENSPACSPRLSIDQALSDFFDPPASSVGKRKKAPKKRKSTEMDSYSESDLSELSIKCSTPKVNLTLHSILSSKQKRKNSVKKVRFSDEVSTNKVTFRNEEIEAYSNDPDSKAVNSSGAAVPPAHRDNSKFAECKQENETFDKTSAKQEKMANIPDHLKSSHGNGSDKESREKVHHVDLLLKSSITENMTYCKRRLLKMKLKKELNNSIDTDKPSDRKFDTEVQNKIDETKLCTNTSEISSNRSEDSEVFSQVSPSALTEMCNIAHNVSDDSQEKKKDKQSLACKDNVEPNPVIKATHSSSITGKENLFVAAKTSKLKETSSNKMFVKSAATNPKKFFYPSSKQISTSCPKKLFEYQDKGDRDDNMSLVRSVSHKDIIQKPLHAVKVMRKCDRKSMTESKEISQTEKIQLNENDGSLTVNAVVESNIIPVSVGHQQLSRSPEVKTGSVKDGFEENITLQKARKLVNVENDVEQNRKFPLEEVSVEFKLASGNTIKLEEKALRKAEQLMSEDSYESHKMGIKVSCESIQKAQKLISNVTVSPKENKLSQGIVNKGMSLKNECEVNDNKGDSEFSQWFEEMEVANTIENEVIDSHNLKQTEESSTTSDSSIDPRINYSNVVISINSFKSENDKLESEMTLVKDNATQLKGELERPVNTDMSAFSTAGGIKIVVNERAMQKAEKLMSSAADHGITKPSDTLESKSKLDFGSVGAAGDCPKLLNFRPSHPSISNNNQGFKTASGKILNVSDAALKKASDLVENLVYEIENMESFDESKAKKSNTYMGYSSNSTLISAKDTILRSSSNLSAELEEQIQKAESLEEMNKPLSSSKNKQQNQFVESHGSNSMKNGFQGFKSASGQTFHITEASLKKAASLMICDNKDNLVDGKASFQKQAQLEEKQGYRKNLLTCVKFECNQKGPEIESVEDELENILALKKSSTKNSHTKIPSSAESIGRFPPGGEVPKGFRPFKAPRITQPKKIEDATNYHDKDSAMKLGNRVCRRTLNKKEHQENVDIPKIGGTASEKSNVSKPSEVVEKNEETSADRNSLALSSYNNLNSDHSHIPGKNNKNLEINKCVKNAATIKQQEVYVTDTEECYDGLLSQMFADDMEPEEVPNPKSLPAYDGIRLVGNKSTENCEKKENLNKRQDSAIGEKESNKVQMKETGLINNDAQKRSGTDYSTDFGGRLLNINGIEFGGFATASGKKVNIEGDSLSKARSIFNDSCIELKVEISDRLECESVVKVKETDVGNKDKFIVPELEQLSSEVRHKIPKDSEVLNLESAASSSMDILNMAFDKKLDLSKKIISVSQFCDVDITAQKLKEDVKEDEQAQIVPEMQANTEYNVSSNFPDTAKIVKSDTTELDLPQIQTKRMYVEGLGEKTRTRTGFQTENETAISSYDKTNDIPKDATDKQQLLGSCHFQTASGKSVSVSEMALKSARDSLYESDKQVDIPQTVTCPLFQTASGKRVSLSENALKNARETLSDSWSDTNLLTTVSESIKRVASSETELKCNSDPRVNEKNNVSDKASGRKQLKKSCLESFSVSTENSLFQTASGKEVTVSKKSLITARNSLKETILTDEEHDSLFQIPSCDFVDTSKLSRDKLENLKTEFPNISKNVITVEAQKGAKDSLKSMDINHDIFPTANVSTPEHLLKNEKSSFNNSAAVFETANIAGSCVFQTASGKNVNVSEQALNKAKNCLNESEVNLDIPKITYGSIFQTASGKNVNVSKEALNKARTCLNDLDTNLDENKVSGRSLFQTAGGKSINLSKEALNKATSFLTESETNLYNLKSDKSLYPTSSSKCIAGTEKPLKEEDNWTDLNMPDVSGSLRSGKNVAVSEEALTEKENCSSESSLGSQNAKSQMGSASLFQTASGRRVSVSDKALKAARDSLREPTADRWDNKIGKCLDSLSVNQTSSNVSNESFNPLFQTASGRRVSVSDKALKAARDSLREPETDSCDSEIGKCLESSSVNQTSSNVRNKNFCSLFQTASGKSVSVSEKALNVARESFRNAEESNVMIEKCQSPLYSLTGNHNEKSLSDEGSLFQTASGKNVEISDNALRMARDTYRKSDSNGLQTEGLVDDFEHLFKIKLPNTESGSLFQSASGKNVDVSANASHIAKDILDFSENENANNMVHIDAKKRQSFGGAASSGIENQMDIRMSLEALSRMKRKLFESRNDISKGKRLKADEDDTENTPLKRQRLDGDLCGEVQHGRKPLKTGPEGLLTDRKSAISRGFKPVHSRTLFKPPARMALNDLTKEMISTSKKNTPTKSPFQTPYKTTTKSPEAMPASTVEVIAPVFLPKDTQNKPGREKLTVAIPVLAVNGKGAVTTDLGPCQDRLQSFSDASKLNIGRKENSSNVSQSHSSGNGFKTESNAESKTSSTGDISTENTDGKEYGEEFETTGNLTVEEDKRQIEEMDTNTARNSFNSEMDICTQNDDTELFYCNLVEARKQQEDVIKEKQKLKIQPIQGRLYRQKQHSGRSNLKDFVRILRQGCKQSVSKSIAVTSSTAREYKFKLKEYYGDNITQVLVGDGASLVPDDTGCVGKEEFHSAFLTLEGVDPKLISDTWTYNHYRWIIWKLAAYETVCPFNKIGRYLTPEMVMLQLKYRYDREIDLCERSALKKIFERDDAPSKRMVLCVAAIHRWSDSARNQATAHELDSKISLELTDGWYSINAQLDVPLTDLVRQGKITLGQKLCMSGAELVGGEDACSPLEAPESLMLKIGCNSCRPAPWDSVLGYQSDPRPLCVPLTGLKGEGGTVGMINLIIIRKYPVMYMEKLPGGGCVFRTGRAEEKAQQAFQSRQQENMEKIYRQIESEMEKEEKEERQSISKKKWSRSEVEYLQSGREIYEALTSSRQPDMIESLLTDKQICRLMDYKRQLHDEKQQELNSRFQKAWQDRDEGVSVRNVTPVLKFRVAGCAHRDMDNTLSTVLTVWRPSPEVCDIEEGKRYKIYCVNTSTARSKYIGHDVQLTATKQTKFQLMNVEENFLDSIYEPREVLWVSDICRRQPPYGEVDFVGVVVKVSQPATGESSSREPDTVYCADCQGNLLAIKFWQGVRSYDDGLLTEGNVLCCSNLMDKLPYRSKQLPVVEASAEFTHLTNKPQNSGQRQAVTRLNSLLKEKQAFLDRAASLLSESLEKKGKATPQKRKYLASNSDSEITPTKASSDNLDNQKLVAMETKSDLDLNMSVDSSFEEEICKEDFDKVLAEQEINVLMVEQVKTDNSMVSNTGMLESAKVNRSQENLIDVVENISEQEHLSEVNVCCNTSVSQGASQKVVSDRDDQAHPYHDQNNSKLPGDSDKERGEGENVSGNQSPSLTNERTEKLQSVLREDRKLMVSDSKTFKTSNQSIGEETVSKSNLLTPKSQLNTPKSQLNTPKVQLNTPKRLLNTVRENNISGSRIFPALSNSPNLVRSPEEDVKSRLTPQTPSSQHNLSGLTPQTPRSQPSRADYQDKMARLLSYGSPSPVTPMRTPISKTASRGFKPPSLVKK